MIRILHIADTHIGYSAYRKLNEVTGLNQREMDTYDAFKQFVDYAVAASTNPGKLKVDLIVHAGDLFDSVRPSNRAISFVIGQLLRLSEAGIPFIVIEGNHERPRLKETGSVFSLLEHIPNVQVVYGDSYKILEFQTFEKSLIRIHAIPHSDDIENEKKRMLLAARSNLRETELNETDNGSDNNNNNGFRFNIALIHASVSSSGSTGGGDAGSGPAIFLMEEFNEQIVGIDDMINFDYIALGHYHKYTRVREDAYYAGSTERFSFDEVNDDKCFLEVMLSEEGKKLEVIVHRLRTREMVDLKPISCSSLAGLNEIRSAIMHRIRECNPDDKVIRLKVQDIPLQVYHSLDFDELKRLTRSSVHCDIKYDFLRDNELPTAEQPTFRSLRTEFEHFIEKYAIADGNLNLNKERVKELGLQYMQRDTE